mmetsp:Transcript_14375/g.28719  ORF Transcript_14375/g.28719 Transcript_14375/m.28719 type:complete len:433 (-) Transcript_14375:116-1414(-)
MTPLCGCSPPRRNPKRRRSGGGGVGGARNGNGNGTGATCLLALAVCQRRGGQIGWSVDALVLPHFHPEGFSARNACRPWDRSTWTIQGMRNMPSSGDDEEDNLLLSLGEEEFLAYLESDDLLIGDHGDYNFVEDIFEEDQGGYDWEEDWEEEPDEEVLVALESGMESGLGSADDGGRGGSGTGVLADVLRAGVVPADAAVGSGVLPGDFGFDPLCLATSDLFRPTQRALVDFVNKIWEPPWRKEDREKPDTEGADDGRPRPKGLLLRDYAEAEIRHGRVAMLAAVFWPLQEIADRLFIPTYSGETTIVYGGTTLPYLPLLMTFFMLNLGYLDIYSQAVKDMDAGEAFVPGDCFWDPLSILADAPDSARWSARTAEVANGRAAMVAVIAFFVQEAATSSPVITLPWNLFLFEPAYEIPVVRALLDCAGGGMCE